MSTEGHHCGPAPCPECGEEHSCICGWCNAWTTEHEHEHIATLQDPEHCVRCGERLEYDENGNRK